MTPTSPPRQWPLALIGNLAVGLLLLAIAIALLRLHGGDWWPANPSRDRWLLAGLGVLAYAGFCGVLAWRSRPHATLPTTDVDRQRSDSQPPILVAWASQTGFARELAERSATILRDAGKPVRLCALHQLQTADLMHATQALFVASTTGEGDPPDHVLGFLRKVMTAAPRLDGLHYAVLALGDREYADFCAFGHRLDHWLRRQDAQPLFDLVEVDNADASALRHWQHHIGQLAGRTDLPDWSAPAYAAWRLTAREHLNAGSPGDAAYHVALVPQDASELTWKAGDIAEIGPRHAPAEVAAWLASAQLDGQVEVSHDDVHASLASLLVRSKLPEVAAVNGLSAQAVADALSSLPHREYSIASLPADGSLQLLVRQMRHADGRLGSGSGWLTEYAALGASIDLRVRSNPSFHAPTDARPLILIGNGTGLAGLRAVLKARIAAGHTRNWLLFGERTAAHDYFYRDEIEGWQRDGGLEHVDLAFSRDHAERTYVQDVLRAQRERLQAWLDQGAAVYVCGSLEGMAPAVDSVLREAVGIDALESMAADGRYRRDVY